MGVFTPDFAMTVDDTVVSVGSAPIWEQSKTIENWSLRIHFEYQNTVQTTEVKGTVMWYYAV